MNIEAVDQLNSKMNVICYSFDKLIKAQMKDSLKSKGENKEDNEKEKYDIAQLIKQIKKDLKEINKEEQPQGETMKLIEMQIKEEENDWLIIDNYNSKK